MVDEVEEVILFPDLPRPAPLAQVAADEAFDLAGDPAIKLREWLTLQLGAIDNRVRRLKLPAKPAGVTPELAAYLQAHEELVTLKANKDAYMKALNKLTHFARQEGPT